MTDRHPVTREGLQRALAVNALTKPLNVGVGAVVVVAAIALGALWLIAVALVVYAALSAMTFFDEAEAQRVGERSYGRARVGPAPIDAKGLAAPIRAQLEQARAEQRSIAATIAGSDLSWVDVRGEVDELVGALEAAARRAQRLQVYLGTQDAKGLMTRAKELERAGDEDTAGALRTQLAELDRLATMLRSTQSEMEQVNAALRTVHARLVGVAVSSEASKDAELAGDVRELRARVETLTTGLDSAAS